MWARVLPPLLTILFRFTTIKSIDKTIKRIPVTRRETPLVDEKGETKVTDEPTSSICCGVGMGVRVGVGVGVGVEVGLGVAEEMGKAASLALASGIFAVALS